MEDNKKIRYTIIGVLVLLITITSSTYAYFAITASNSTTVTGTVASVGLVLNVEKITPENSGVDVLIPQLESALGSAISSTYNCIDDNNNTVCQVYRARLTNNGNATVRVKGTIAFSNINNIPHLKWKLIENATSIGTNTGTTASTTATKFITETTINANQTEDYYFVVWIDETGSAQEESGTFTATLTFTDSNGTGLTSTIGAEPAPFTGTIYRNSTEQLFDGRSIVPVSGTKYVITTGEYDAPVGPYETQSECQTALEGFGSPAGYSCQEKTGTFGGISQYSTNVSSINKIYYLKHTIVNNIVTESYVEFVVTPEMASANPGMAAGTYTLRGYTDGTYYTSNVNVLKQAFGENSGYCSSFTNSYSVDCRVSGLYAAARSDGNVIAGDGSANCSVFSDVSSRC